MKVRLDHITFVLHRPQFPENIGAAARAMKNMGITQLRVVAPLDCDLTRILRIATHNVEDVVLNMEIYDQLLEALAPFQFIVGTTARTGSHRQTIRDPRELARELVNISQHNQIAVLFGPEKTGLTNRELQYCDSLVTIPTAQFSSINLAQAVMIIAYEIFLASTDPPKAFVPRLADRWELEGMYEHLTKTLVKINFINPQNPEYWINSVRRFFSRVGLRARDVKVIRGMCRQMDWYVEERLRSKERAPSAAIEESCCKGHEL